LFSPGLPQNQYKDNKGSLKSSDIDLNMNSGDILKKLDEKSHFKNK
jgi:hypothetical protein